jgi:hypothetical protein
LAAYVCAGPRFANAYADDIAAHIRRAEEEVELSQDGCKCGVYEMIVDSLYAGQAVLSAGGNPIWSRESLVYTGPLARLQHPDLGLGSQARGVLGKGVGWKVQVIRSLP